ncbi:MAG: prolyl aminopeptidase [Alphaproteobacteria bacterium]
MTSRDLFPPLAPYATGFLPVDDLHTLYWEECGNPRGVPVVFLHGGPGAGAREGHRRFFDPQAFRIILFDQRGAGRSRPLAETRQNTTELLVGDMEKLRAHRGVARWHLFGGSWGSTLALAYAQAHPDRCLGLILRGIFLMRPAEIDWFLYGIRNIFPDQWEKFAAHIPPARRHDLLAAYLELLNHPDPAAHHPAARIWARYERACACLMPDETAAQRGGTDDPHDLAIARIEAHYFAHNQFAPPAKLLDGISKIRKIPGVIVQGRYDVICPAATAHDLHRAWPEADFRIIPDAGHSALEPGIRRALVAATERFKNIRE